MFVKGENKMEKASKNAPIGVFDSGVGGLTVVREIMRQIPNEKIIYFGDTARVPYGSKSAETVTAREIRKKSASTRFVWVARLVLTKSSLLWAHRSSP